MTAVSSWPFLLLRRGRSKYQSGPDMVVKATAKEQVFKKLVPQMFAIIDGVREKQVSSEESTASPATVDKCQDMGISVLFVALCTCCSFL